MIKKIVLWGLCLMFVGCASNPPPPTIVPVFKPKIALVLGGGAARGFAHIGAIKILEAQGITPDWIVGTSAGSVVGVLYAAGYGGFELQKIAFDLDQSAMEDWTVPDRGFIKGEALQNFINKALNNQPIEKLKIPFAVVATDLASGEAVVFQRGNAGIAVRASSAVPGVFQPVRINGHEYVDGGLVSPLPIKIARSLGADIVIAVDVAAQPKNVKVSDSAGLLLQTFAIMGRTIRGYEQPLADILIQPELSKVNPTSFEDKHLAILEGERAALAAMPLIRQKLKGLNRLN